MRAAGGIIEGIEFIESPNFNHRPEPVMINLIVIHAISLPPQNYDTKLITDFFLNRLAPGQDPYLKNICHLKVSSHFLITREGDLIQLVPLHKRAWHAGISQFEDQENCNDFSIGIELEGCDEQAFTPNQYTKLSELIKFLKTEYDIPLDRVVGHSDIAPDRKTDPGPHFNWNLLKSLI